MPEEQEKQAKAADQTEQVKESKKTEEAAQAAESAEKQTAGAGKKKWSKEIKKIGDEIVGLTLMQAKELADYLKEEYDIEPAAGGAVVMAGPAGQGQAEPEQEKTSFDVILKSFGDKKIQVIKEVRALTSLGLKEAKELVDGVPKPVKQGLSKEDAEAAMRQLEAAGAVVELA